MLLHSTALFHGVCVCGSLVRREGMWGTGISKMHMLMYVTDAMSVEVLFSFFQIPLFIGSVNMGHIIPLPLLSEIDKCES